MDKDDKINLGKSFHRWNFYTYFIKSFTQYWNACQFIYKVYINIWFLMQKLYKHEFCNNNVNIVPWSLHTYLPCMSDLISYFLMDLTFQISIYKIVFPQLCISGFKSVAFKTAILSISTEKIDPIEFNFYPQVGGNRIAKCQNYSNALLTTILKSRTNFF